MREIKFRAYDNWEGKMLPEVNLEKLWQQGASGEYRDLKGNSLIWLQYTNLKDKNGKEIYEGDVVKASYGGERRRFKIFWSSNVGAWATEEIGGWDVMEQYGSIFPQDGMKRNRVEVIGNIYENPELLKDTNYRQD